MALEPAGAAVGTAKLGAPVAAAGAVGRAREGGREGRSPTSCPWYPCKPPLPPTPPTMCEFICVYLSIVIRTILRGSTKWRRPWCENMAAPAGSIALTGCPFVNPSLVCELELHGVERQPIGTGKSPPPPFRLPCMERRGVVQSAAIAPPENEKGRVWGC